MPVHDLDQPLPARWRVSYPLLEGMAFMRRFGWALALVLCAVLASGLGLFGGWVLVMSMDGLLHPRQTLQRPGDWGAAGIFMGLFGLAAAGFAVSCARKAHARLRPLARVRRPRR